MEKKVEEVARKAVVISASALLATVGAAFLTGAAWLLLVEIRSPLFAATVIGAVYFGVALVGFALATPSSRSKIAHQTQTEGLNGLSPLQLVVVSFLQGLEQGARNKRKS